MPKLATKSRPSSPKGTPPQMSLRFGNDPLLWACWLYYEEGLNQGEVAEKMGVSRATVNTYLADAKARGIVDITIQIDQLQTLSVAQALKEHFGLQECLVIPTEGADGTLIGRLGRAGALALGHVLQSGDRIAVGWGRTVSSVGTAMTTDHDLQDMSVVQAIGAVSGHQDDAPETCARLFAEALRTKYTQISAPAIVSSRAMRDQLHQEPLIGLQLARYDTVNRAVFGISSLRPQSTIHSSGFFDDPALQKDHYAKAAGAIFGRFFDDRGRAVSGPLDDRMIGMTLDQLLRADQRIAIAGGFDKVSAILAALRGGYANVLVTDMATGRGILTADGREVDGRKGVTPRGQAAAPLTRTRVKKLINAPADAVKEALGGIVAEHARYLAPLDATNRALVTTGGPVTGKVGLVIGGGSGHEPSFYGFVGPGMADAVAIGNIFASPPPGPILACTVAADQGAGVLHVFGNYSGDIMNFGMAADMAKDQGIDVRTIITTDDVASSAAEDLEGRRGVAGNVFTFKIAGAACAGMYDLETCEALVRRANARTFTVGLALESCSLPDTGRPSFLIGEDEVEVGVGIHGEPGVERRQLGRADDMTDLMVDKILAEMKPETGDRIALLVNSLGGTPLMELYIINRRVRQRLAARGIDVHASWTGSYCTSLDMVGVSVSMLHLDDVLIDLLDAPCDAAMFRVG